VRAWSQKEAVGARGTLGTRVTSRAFRRRGSEASFDLLVAKQKCGYVKLHESEDWVAVPIQWDSSHGLKRAVWHSSLDGSG
jgi:hypothetical protein